jgi:hypothetical protein
MGIKSTCMVERSVPLKMYLYRSTLMCRRQVGVVGCHPAVVDRPPIHKGVVPRIAILPHRGFITQARGDFLVHSPSSMQAASSPSWSELRTHHLVDNLGFEKVVRVLTSRWRWAVPAGRFWYSIVHTQAGHLPSLKISSGMKTRVTKSARLVGSFVGSIHQFGVAVMVMKRCGEAASDRHGVHESGPHDTLAADVRRSIHTKTPR